MKRPFVPVIPFMLLGAALTVAVGWGPILLIRFPFHARLPAWTTLKPPAHWPRPVPEHWSAPSGSGTLDIWWLTLRSVRNDDGDTAWTVGSGQGLWIRESGWPMRAMSWCSLGDTWSTRMNNDFAPIGSIWHDGIGLEPMYGPPHYWQLWRRLPARPIWPGFAVDTALYAAVLFALRNASVAVRRAWRRCHAHCPACGYDARGLEQCPECGTPGTGRIDPRAPLPVATPAPSASLYLSATGSAPGAKGRTAALPAGKER